MARQVTAVARAFDLLELFHEREEFSQPEMVDRLQLPRTTVHELVNTMLERGYLARSLESDRKVRLGVKTFELGSRYADRIDLASEGTAAARLVAQRCDETVQVMVRDGAQVLYVAKVDSRHSVRLVSAVGRRLPAHCTAGGKALLASAPPDELEAILSVSGGLVAMTPKTVTSPTVIKSELARIRQEGLAWEYCESNDAVACVAAPVRDATGAVVAAMSISVPTVRWSDEVKPSLAEAVRSGADDLSHRLGASIHPA